MGQHPKERPEAQGKSIAQSTLGRWLLLASLLGVLCWSSARWLQQAPRPKSPLQWLPQAQQKAAKSFQAVTKDFGFTRSILVGLGAPAKEDVFSARMLKLNRRLTKSLQKSPGVANVLSIASSQAISKEQGALVVRAMMPAKIRTFTTTVQRKLRQQVMGDPLLRGSLVSPDARFTFLIMQLKPVDPKQPQAAKRQLEHLQRLIERSAHRHRFARITLTGVPVTGPTILQAVTKDARAFGPVALALFLLLFGVGFVGWAPRWRGLVLLCFVPLIAFAGSLGLFGKLQPHLLWLPLVGWWLAATLWIRPQRWSQGPQKPRGPHDPMPLNHKAARNITVAIAGSASLAWLLLPQGFFRELGPAALFGGIAALICTWLLLPSTLLLPTPQAKLAPPKALPSGMWWIVIIGLGSGIFGLQKGGLVNAVYPTKSRIAVGEQLQEKHFGAAAPLLIRFQGDLRDPTALKAMERLSRRLEAHKEIFAPQSIAGLIRQLNYLMNKWPRVPDKSRQINALWMFLEGQPALKSLVRKQGKDAILQARVKLASRWQPEALLKAIHAMTQDIPRQYKTVALSTLSPAAQAQVRKRRMKWIEEGLKLWLLRHTGLSLPPALQDPTAKIISTFVTAAGQAPKPEPLAPLRLHRKLAAYLGGQDCDLELNKALQRKTLKALLLTNRSGRLLQPGTLKSTLLSALKGSPAAKDKDSIKYAMRALQHILDELYKQQHLERFQQALFGQFRRDKYFIEQLSQQLRKQGHTTAQIRMAELQGELMECFSSTTYIRNNKKPQLALQITGLPALTQSFQGDAHRGLIFGALLFCLATLLLLSLFLRERLSSWRIIATLLLTWTTTLGAMGLLGIPLHLATAILLLLLGVLTLLIAIPVALTPPSQRSFQYLIRCCLWITIPLAPFLFSSLPILQHAAAVLCLGPWLAASITTFLHQRT